MHERTAPTAWRVDHLTGLDVPAGSVRGRYGGDRLPLAPLMLADGEAPAVLPGLAADRRAGLLADTGTASETAARSLALLSAMADDGEPEQLDGGDVVREVAACLGDFPELVVQGVEGGATLGLRASGRHEMTEIVSAIP